jgi:hypothetical protein
LLAREYRAGLTEPRGEAAVDLRAQRLEERANGIAARADHRGQFDHQTIGIWIAGGAAIRG